MSVISGVKGVEHVVAKDGGKAAEAKAAKAAETKAAKAAEDKVTLSQDTKPDTTIREPAPKTSDKTTDASKKPDTTTDTTPKDPKTTDKTKPDSTTDDPKTTDKKHTTTDKGTDGSGADASAATDPGTGKTSLLDKAKTHIGLPGAGAGETGAASVDEKTTDISGTDIPGKTSLKDKALGLIPGLRGIPGMGGGGAAEEPSIAERPGSHTYGGADGSSYDTAYGSGNHEGKTVINNYYGTPGPATTGGSVYDDMEAALRNQSLDSSAGMGGSGIMNRFKSLGGGAGGMLGGAAMGGAGGGSMLSGLAGGAGNLLGGLGGGGIESMLSNLITKAVTDAIGPMLKNLLPSLPGL